MQLLVSKHFPGLFFYLQTKDFKKTLPTSSSQGFSSSAPSLNGIKQHSFKGILIYTEDWV